MQFICYPKCSTCQKAKKWLDENKIAYTERHIVEANPSENELRTWYERSGLPLKKFFNTSGMLYKEMKLKDKLPTMSEDEQITKNFTNIFQRTEGCTEEIIVSPEWIVTKD